VILRPTGSRCGGRAGSAPLQRQAGAKTGEAGPQRRAFHAGRDVSGEIAGGKPGVRTRAIRLQAPLRPVLHTDQEHPHVHLAIKAISEHGQRLNIRKATLRDWRRQFAHHLRAQGIAANATERAVRAENRTPMLDGVYRAARRRMSIRMRQRVEHIASQLQRGGLPAESGKTKLLETRAIVTDGWRTVADALVARATLN